MNMTTEKTVTPADEESAAKKARMMGAIKLPEPPKLPSFSRGIAPNPAQPVPLPIEASTSSQETPSAEVPAARQPPSTADKTTRSASKPNFSAMRKRAEKRDPVAGKPLADDEMIQMTHYLTAKERREFKILTVLNGHSMNEVIRHAVTEYIALHRAKLPR